MMRPTSLRDFSGPSKASGEHINFQICPVCGSDKWKVFVNPETGGWNCFAGRCGAKGYIDVGLGDTASAGGAILSRLHEEPETPVWEEIELPPWHELTGAATRYLRRRGIDEELSRKLGLVEWEDKSRILFPYFDRQGQLIYWNSRRFSERMGEGPKYLTAPGRHPLYVLRSRWCPHCEVTQEACEDEVLYHSGWAYGPKHPPRPLVLVEGVFDAIAVWRAGFDAVALGGKSLPRYLVSDLLTLVDESGILVVMLDPDALDAALRIRNVLFDRVHVKVVPLMYKDPGDMSPEEIKEALCA